MKTGAFRRNPSDSFDCISGIEILHALVRLDWHRRFFCGPAEILAPSLCKSRLLVYVHDGPSAEQYN